MKIAAVKLLQRMANGTIREVISVPKFEIPDEFIQSLFNIHLADANGKPNFKKIEGESQILSFYSGNKEVFMVEPNFDLIVIPDGPGDEKEYLRACRILLNNILVHVADQTLETYIQSIVDKINSEGTASLKIEKKEVKTQSSITQPSPLPEPSQQLQDTKQFSDIVELVEEIKEPIGGSSAGGADPFGGSSAGGADPFGGSSASTVNPFVNSSVSSGGSMNEMDGQNRVDDFKSFDPNAIFKSAEDDIAFAENPWELEGKDDKKDKKDEKEVDPFSENPFG